jgi:hypothetical protein
MTLLRRVIMAIAFPLAVCAVGRVLIAQAVRTPPGPDSAWLHLADRVERLRVTAVLVCGDELFVGFVADFPTELAARAWEWWPTTAPERGWNGGWRTPTRRRPIAVLTAPS